MDERYLFDDLPEPAPDLNARAKPLRRWDGGHALLFFVLSALASLLAALALVKVIGFYASIIISEVVVFAVVPFLLRPVFDTGWRTWTQRPQFGWPFWFWCMAAVVSFAIVQSNLPVLLDRVWPIPKEQFEFFRENLAAGSARQFLLLLLVAAVVPGVCEEIAFRGLIQTGLRRSFGTNHAIIWGGAMFALLHLNPWNFVGLWTFGVLLGYLRERTGSIIPAVAAHITNNSLALAMFAMQSPEDWEQPPEFLPWYAVVPAGAVLVYSVLRLHRITTDSAAKGVSQRSIVSELPT